MWGWGEGRWGWVLQCGYPLTCAHTCVNSRCPMWHLLGCSQRVEYIQITLYCTLSSPTNQIASLVRDNWSNIHAEEQPQTKLSIDKGYTYILYSTAQEALSSPSWTAPTSSFLSLHKCHLLLTVRPHVVVLSLTVIAANDCKQSWSWFCEWSKFMNIMLCSHLLHNETHNTILHMNNAIC